MKAKIILTYRDVEDDIAEETVWANKKGNYYQIDNIPFFAPNIALGDIISVEKEGEFYHFDDLVTASGHSTIQIVFFENKNAIEIMKKIEKVGCSWEGFNSENNYFALDVPPEIEYAIVKSELDVQFENKILDYKESCLAN